MNKRAKIFLIFIGILFSLLCIMFLFCEWYPVSDGPPNEYSISLTFFPSILIAPVFLASWCAYIFVPLALIGRFFIKGKGRSILLILGIIFLMAYLVAGSSRSFAWKIRKSSFERVSQRAEPIIHAIESYLEQEKKVPESLDDLIPKYIDTIAGTGIRAYPTFKYEIPKAQDQYYKELYEKYNVTYELRVDCGYVGLNWDCFVYWPSESYPEHMYGGVTELINKWAYVHE